MKYTLLLAALAGLGGCASTLRGPDTCAEIHFDATYVLARWAGWPEAEAAAIAAADFWTDKHGETNSVATEWRLIGGVVNPVTLPWVLCWGFGDLVVSGESPSRAFGKRVAESTAWAVPALGHRLHFPSTSTSTREPVTPAFFVNAASGEVEYGNVEARRVLERAFLEFQCHEQDSEAGLALLGIGLHTLQDSFKHCGYTASQGHIGADPDPDRPCCSLDRTLLCAEMTLSSLRYARRLVAGRSSAPPPGWKEALRRVFDVSVEPDAHRRWERFVREAFPEDYPERDAMVEAWLRNRGDEAFERALERVRDALR